MLSVDKKAQLGERVCLLLAPVVKKYLLCEFSLPFAVKLMPFAAAKRHLIFYKREHYDCLSISPGQIRYEKSPKTERRAHFPQRGLFDHRANMSPEFFPQRSIFDHHRAHRPNFTARSRLASADHARSCLLGTPARRPPRARACGVPYVSFRTGGRTIADDPSHRTPIARGRP